MGFIRRLLGRETVSDVAADFPDQLRLLKVIFYKWFAVEFSKLPDMDRQSSGVIAGQVVNYLTGEDLDAASDNLDEKVKTMIAALRPDVPEIADNLMSQNRELREIIVHTLRMRLVLNLHYQAGEAAASGLEKRITDLLMNYGPEFQEELTPRRYNQLVANVMNWAESSDFPGRRE
jgi:hypothetical protein